MKNPSWKFKLFYCAWEDNADESKWKARLNSYSMPSVGKGISKKNLRKGNCGLATVPNQTMPWSIKKTISCNLPFSAFFCVGKAVLRLSLLLPLSPLLKRKHLQTVIWIQPAGIRVLCWIRTRSLYPPGLSHWREMQVAIISQVQNRITKSLEAGVVQHLLDPWKQMKMGLEISILFFQNSGY